MSKQDRQPGHGRRRANAPISRRRAILRAAAGAGAALVGAQLLASAAQAAVIKGRLAPGGNTATYSLAYPADMSVYTISLQVFPDDARVLQNTGFKVFGPQAGRVYVTGGAQPGLRPNVAANLISADPGPYTIQVYNYDPITPIDYELSVAGNRPEGQQVAGSAPAPVDLGGQAAAALGGSGVVVVDSHAHATPVWYEPIETLVNEMDRNGVAYADLCQINTYFDDAYQEEQLRRYPGRFANIVLVDYTRPDAVDQFNALVARGVVSGLRMHPEWRSPGDDPLALWRAAARAGVSISVNGGLADFADDSFAKVFEALPELPIMLEHTAGASISENPPYAQSRKALNLARYPNAYCHFGGFGDGLARRSNPARGPFPFDEPLPPLMGWAFDSFGPNRMVWGSDFPPVAGREGYAMALQLPMQYFASRPLAERRAMFGGNALKLFPIKR
ncbi:MAG TPA: amidohydrolase family protein [Chloroflexota bacterium]